jgi:hypothetical protein
MAPTGYHDVNGRPMAMLAMREAFDCPRQQWRVINATEVDPKGHIIDYTVYNDKWVPIKLTTSKGHANVLSSIYAQVCPAEQV